MAKNKFIWRRGIIYAYSCKYPNSTRRDRWAYVGQTRQSLVARHQQHMDIQPWSDLYPEIRIVFQFKRCPNWWLDLVEKYTIKFTKPTYNYTHNTRNPSRTPKYKAIADRKARDMLRKVPRRGRMFR